MYDPDMTFSLSVTPVSCFSYILRQYRVGLQVGARIWGEMKNNGFVSSLHINFGESRT